MSELNLETGSVEKLKLDTSEESIFGKFDPKDIDLEKEILRYIKNLTLFDCIIYPLYHFAEFVGPDFAWPPTMNTSERRIIFDCIAHSEGEGDEFAKNHIAYRRFTEVGQLDPSQEEEYRRLATETPGALYTPVIEEVVRLKFSFIEDGTNKKWQVHMRIRNKTNSSITATMTNIERDSYNFRLILDIGATYTIIPRLLKANLPKRLGWSSRISFATGYGANNGMTKVSGLWEVSLGDGVNWTD
ncbi:1709_t:CDS:2 [Ambispora gerdemannii]|uniref:1709_t:CDS:1 n=1 Tax=Ambispora gerdemannii TaxID=144530 RepID=A0A9N9FLY1_9GLOM|nr:1709_t:CDS:2 [Ambispora gerdemannii]